MSTSSGSERAPNARGEPSSQEEPQQKPGEGSAGRAKQPNQDSQDSQGTQGKPGEETPTPGSGGQSSSAEPIQQANQDSSRV